jgi:hypothetical protein
LLQVTFHLSSLFVRFPACLLAGRLRLQLCMRALYVKVDCGASSAPSSAGNSSHGKVLYWSILIKSETREVIIAWFEPSHATYITSTHLPTVVRIPNPCITKLHHPIQSIINPSQYSSTCSHTQAKRAWVRPTCGPATCTTHPTA